MQVKLPAISPLKRVTPAGLMKMEPPSLSVSPGSVARSSKFLTSREHRVFPVSLTKEGEEADATDEHDVRLHAGRRESALRKSLDEAIMTVRLPAVKHARHRNLSTVVQEDRALPVKLPELRARQYAVSPLGKKGTDLEKQPGSYKKLPRSPAKLRIDSPRRAGRGTKKPSLRAELPAAAEVQRSGTPPSDESYDTPAITYGQKVQRIKKLAESTMRMLQV